jgi:hypothetical protein
LFFIPASFRPLPIFCDLINNFFTRDAFPSPAMPAVIKEFPEDYGTSAARTIHRALTIHMTLLNQWITLIQTDGCHDLMTGMLNSCDGGMMTRPGSF